MPVFGVFLVRIFSYSDQIGRDTKYLSVFSPNMGKYALEIFQKGTLFKQRFVKYTFTKSLEIFPSFFLIYKTNSNPSINIIMSENIGQIKIQHFINILILNLIIIFNVILLLGLPRPKVFLLVYTYNSLTYITYFNYACIHSLIT